MKHKQKKTREVSSASLLEYLFPIIPLLALVPNLYIIPDLNYQGLGNQELTIAATTAIIPAIGIYLILKRRGATLSLDRTVLLLAVTIGAFISWQAISLLWTPEWAEGVRVITIWLCFGVIVITGAIVLSSRAAEWLYVSLTLIILILATSQFLEYWMYQGVMLGVFFNHGITAEILATLLPLQLLIFLTSERRGLLILSAVALCAGGVAMLLTLRRGATAGLFLAGICILVSIATRLIRPGDRRRLIVVMAAIAIALAAVVVFKREQIVNRVQGALSVQIAAGGTSREYGLSSRMTKWLTTLEAIKHNPVVGVGAGGFTAVYAEYRRYFVTNPSYAKFSAASEVEDYDEMRNPYAHSEYLQILAELGIVGFVLFCAIWWVIATVLWRSRNTSEAVWTLGCLYGLVAFAVSSGVSGFSFRVSAPALISACLAALGLAKARSAASEPITFSIPRIPALAGLGVLIAVALLLAGRANAVLASQKAQSQIDFRFNPQNASQNEAFLRRYNQVLSLDPSNSGAHLGRALLLYQMKRSDEALADAQFAYRHSYGRPFTPLLMAFIYEQKHDLNSATEILAESLESFPKSLPLRATYAEMLSMQGKHEMAEIQRKQVLERDAILGKSWLIALRMKEPLGKEEAQRQGVPDPGTLEPALVRSLILARAYHYLN